VSASLDQTTASLDQLHAKMEAEARRNGRLELANEILQWWVARRDELPPHLREEFAQLILKVCV
jgi:hypothetical protein